MACPTGLKSEQSVPEHPSIYALAPIRHRVGPDFYPGADDPMTDEIADDLAEARGKLQAAREALLAVLDAQGDMEPIPAWLGG
jgi:hypothetical protein